MQCFASDKEMRKLSGLAPVSFFSFVASRVQGEMMPRSSASSASAPASKKAPEVTKKTGSALTTLQTYAMIHAARKDQIRNAAIASDSAKLLEEITNVMMLCNDLFEHPADANDAAELGRCYGAVGTALQNMTAVFAESGKFRSDDVAELHRTIHELACPLCRVFSARCFSERGCSQHVRVPATLRRTAHGAQRPPS